MEESLQRFFKVLMPGFQTKIMLPPVMGNEELVGEEAKESELISRKGRWKVIIMKSREGRLWFTDGWDEFVRQHDLALGDFVVFKHIGALRFKVTLFDPTCCEKDVLTSDLQPQATRKRGRPARNKVSLDQSQLSVVIKTYNIRTIGSYLPLNRDFCQAHGLNRNKRMRVKGPGGECEINFLRGNKTSYLCKGWHEFVVMNRLKQGDTIIVKPRSNTGFGCTSIDIHVHPAVKIILPT